MSDCRSNKNEYEGTVSTNRNKKLKKSAPTVRQTTNRAGSRKSGVSGYLKNKKKTTNALDAVFDYKK